MGSGRLVLSHYHQKLRLLTEWGPLCQIRNVAGDEGGACKSYGLGEGHHMTQQRNSLAALRVRQADAEANAAAA
jgi:hypothetical protein